MLKGVAQEKDEGRVRVRGYEAGGEKGKEALQDSYK